MNQNEELRRRGYNPLRWNCELQGCFNKRLRPKIEIFFDCFPRNVNFTDVDGIVELNSRGLLLEWKSEPRAMLGTGQGIMYGRLCKDDGNLSTICAAGDAETMRVTHVSSFCSGVFKDWKSADLCDVKNMMRKWTDFALGT